MVALGRVPEFDARSRAFASPASLTPRTVLWRRYGPVLDQGSLGACTGFATAHACNTHPTHKPYAELLTGADARRLYSRATELDPFPGVWPPTDTGSSGLAACKAALQAGHISRYEWAFGFDHMLSVLQTGPVMVGTNWYDSQFTTDAKGFVTVSGRVVGGHEWLVVGCNMRDQYVTALNSWGPGWGLGGRFKLSFPSMRRLLEEHGDAVQPIR